MRSGNIEPDFFTEPDSVKKLDFTKKGPKIFLGITMGFLCDILMLKLMKLKFLKSYFTRFFNHTSHFAKNERAYAYNPQSYYTKVPF